MKKRYRMLCAATVFLLTVILSACSPAAEPQPEPTVDPAEFAELEARIAAAEAKKDSYVYLINAKSDGETLLPIEGKTEISVEADIPEGMKLQSWTVNGVALNTTDESINVTADGNTVIKAEFRPIRKAVCINCRMQFLNYYEYGDGDTFTEFNFEDDYVNTVTGEECAGGSMLLCVQTDVQLGKVLDHWLINGQKMSGYGAPYSFNAYVTEATTFEPVFIEK